MKNIQYIFFSIVLLAISNSCLDKYTEIYTAYSPVYMSYEDLRSAIKKTGPRDLENTGKIYFKDNYIFINEELKGIHIINNSNPSNPANIGFIEIPGNVDIAIKGNILYADSYIDMVAIDISDMNNIHEVKRVEKVFPYTVPPTGDEGYRMANVDQEKGVVISWEIKKVKEEVEHYYYYPVYSVNKEISADYAGLSTTGGSASGGSSFGIGGSMARFGLYDDYLYIVDSYNLYMFDVTDAANPFSIGKQNVGWNVETMFIYDKHMFFGTQNGMLIYSLAVPTVPNYIGQFWHVTSCDPVVISEGYAYITLRGGNLCGNTINRLDVVELSSDYISNTLVASFPLHGPYGLGIDGNILFVCDGDEGLKVYDTTDKLNINDNRIAAFPEINTFDVIPVNGKLFMIGDDGFYQYDYSNLQNISLLSYIPVKGNN